jgi:hypothetical protein
VCCAFVRVRLTTDVPGALEAVHQCRDAARREKQALADLAGRQPAVLGEIREGRHLGVAEAEPASDAAPVAGRRQRLAVQQVA